MAIKSKKTQTTGNLNQKLFSENFLNKNINTPFFAGEETQASCSSATISNSRRNIASTGERTDKYSNIYLTDLPFGADSNYISIADLVVLCRKAYWRFALLRNTIDIMTELANTNLIMEGGSVASKLFFTQWLKRINSWDLIDQFFREYWRSGNVFLYRLDATLNPQDLSKIMDVLNLKISKNIELPIKYILLNPEYVRLEGNVNYLNPRYYKMFTSFELKRLASPRTEEEKIIYKSLPEEIKEKISKNSISGNVYVEISNDKLYTCFYKKQDYEPFAVPMPYSVLEDINAKFELKKIDAAIARTTDWSVLLFTMGDKDLGSDYKGMQVMNELFTNESVKRVIVSDYTTKGQWLIPEIDKILGAAKYEQLDKDIQTGLNNILFNTDSKFANTHIKVEVFVERLKEARNAFINKFLQPEVDRIGKMMGFRKIPSLYFEEISLKDEIQWARIYTRLLELGAITPEETFKAIETGELPKEYSEMIENQRRLVKDRDEGLFQPFLNSTQKSGTKENGRPSGSDGIPQSSKNISPIGTQGSTNHQNKEFFDMSLLQDNIKKSSELRSALELKLKSKYKIRRLKDEQYHVISQLVNCIISNEKKGEWISKIDDYINEPKFINQKSLDDINNIIAEHNVSEDLAVLLSISRK